MIKTRFVIELYCLEINKSNYLERITEMPYKLSEGDDLDIDGEGWVAPVSSLCFDIIASTLLAYIDIEQIDTKAEHQDLLDKMVSIGWLASDTHA